MKESQVFSAVANKLENLGWSLYVHSSRANKPKFMKIIKSYPTHSISIDGLHPDILGFDKSDKIIGVKVRGNRDLLKGVRHALRYKKGVQTSFLACDNTVFLMIDNTSHQTGISGLAVGSNVKIINSGTYTSPSYLSDTERELNRLRMSGKSMGKLTRLNLSQPLNFLVPSLIVSTSAMDRLTLKERIENQYSFHAPNHVIEGSLVLDILRKENPNRFIPGEFGTVAKAVMRGMGIRRPRDLKKFKDTIPPAGTLSEVSTVLGNLLKQMYMTKRDFLDFLEALHSYTGQVDLYELSKKLLRTYPNLFSRLFCSSRKKHLIEKK